MLAGAAIASTEDPLIGLKENVIIGKLIPAGSGFDIGKLNPALGLEAIAAAAAASAAAVAAQEAANLPIVDLPVVE